MRIGAFEVVEPLPELRNTCAISMLRPWVDVGRVGSLVLNALERYTGAEELGRLARPGNFFDFTRYRPRMKVSIFWYRAPSFISQTHINGSSLVADR